jgi:hypothetical protein
MKGGDEMIKRLIAIVIVTAFTFLLLTMPIMAVNEDVNGDGYFTLYDFWDYLKDDALQAGEDVVNSSIIRNLIDPNRSFTDWWEAEKDSLESFVGEHGLIPDTAQNIGNTLGGYAQIVYDYVHNQFIPEYTASGSPGVVNQYDNSIYNTYMYYIKTNNTTRYFNSDNLKINYEDNKITFRPNITKWLLNNKEQNPMTQGWLNVDFSDIIETNILINYPVSYTGKKVEPIETPSIPTFKPDTLTSEQLNDFLNALDAKLTPYIGLNYPDYSSIEGMLQSILAILQEGQNQGISAADLQSLADRLGCDCPTAEELSTAILSAMDSRDINISDDDKTFNDVVEVLLDVKNGTDNLDELVGKIDDLIEKIDTMKTSSGGSLTFADMEIKSNELINEAPNIANTLIEKLSSIKGVDEFIAISTALRDFQDALTTADGAAPEDINIDLSYLGAGTISIFHAADFMQGGKFYEGLKIAKALVSIFILGAWLVLMRKKYTSML